MSEPNNEGLLMVLTGASRSGKTARTIAESQKFQRVLVWDIEGQYKAKYRAETPVQLFNILTKLQHYAGVVAYTGKLSEYDYFCKMAYWWGCVGDAAKVETAVILEETADVTKANWCPENHGILCRRGLKRGITIFAITQRPAESDKTAFSNAGVIVSYRLNFDTDKARMKSALGVPLEEIDSLISDKEQNRFEYIERDMRSGKRHRGLMQFKRGKPQLSVIKPL